MLIDKFTNIMRTGKLTIEYGSACFYLLFPIIIVSSKAKLQD